MNALSEHIQNAADDASVVFSFDGEVLKIRCGAEVIAISGRGAPWDCRYSLQAGQLRELPKRLMRRQVGFSVWKGKFTISNWTYQGVKEESNGGVIARM